MAKLLVYHLEGVRAHCFLRLLVALAHGRWSHSVTGKGIHELLVVHLSEGGKRSSSRQRESG